ncbi:MAG TPA: class I SAM-dependent methyltransferase [Gaiellaceae bacterium]|nr:class I SAM-dependent methyltransferase [Gaiellaceae bacterium]
MTRLDDPSLVADEYADETRLRRRAAMFTGAGIGEDARVPAVAAVAQAKPRRILEVGCGWGELAEWLARETGAEVVATDLSPRMVELARERGVDARLADVCGLPFEDASFDAVVAAWMLYHVARLDVAVAELARVLRPGGTLVAITNSAFHLQELRDLVGSGPSPSTFTRENGEAILSAEFAAVKRTDLDGRFDFDSRSAIEEYVRASISMSPFVGSLPVDVALPFSVRRGSSMFVATKAA